MSELERIEQLENEIIPSIQSKNTLKPSGIKGTLKCH